MHSTTFTYKRALPGPRMWRRPTLTQCRRSADAEPTLTQPMLDEYLI